MSRDPLNSLNTIACKKIALLIDRQPGNAFLESLVQTLSDEGTVKGAYEAIMIAYIVRRVQAVLSKHATLQQWFRNFLGVFKNEDYCDASAKYTNLTIYRKGPKTQEILMFIRKLVSRDPGLWWELPDDVRAVISKDEPSVDDALEAFRVLVKYRRAYLVPAQLYYICMNVFFEVGSIVDDDMRREIDFFFIQNCIVNKEHANRVEAYIRDKIDEVSFPKCYNDADRRHLRSMDDKDNLEEFIMAELVAYCDAWHTKTQTPSESRVIASGKPTPRSATPVILICYVFTKALYDKEQRNAEHFQAISHFVRDHFDIKVEISFPEIYKILVKRKGDKRIQLESGFDFYVEGVAEQSAVNFLNATKDFDNIDTRELPSNNITEFVVGCLA